MSRSYKTVCSFMNGVKNFSEKERWHTHTGKPRFARFLNKYQNKCNRLNSRECARAIVQDEDAQPKYSLNKVNWWRWD